MDLSYFKFNEMSFKLKTRSDGVDLHC